MFQYKRSHVGIFGQALEGEMERRPRIYLTLTIHFLISLLSIMRHTPKLDECEGAGEK